ncbi:uncharacterized protein EV420DRAFT_1768488 [Desarmillaria tabescens]|uniref:HAM1-like N-terminal domain-containing protein n=1 Tax=Armillaria tabescens TaxID=1929756 RepID=A0AA39JJU8_ARMTA|nr:uncharacterized protein EV420DRAFT_1768488 [Desarmillaria tabescens]KAK0443978.1 hypothetical protein EV420DRAFT_1768488 [Desarmillaria tabescens]
MGLCLSSCCRRRRRHRNGSSRRYQYSEESPLLGGSLGGAQSTTTSTLNVVNKFVEIVAALKTGKYPSQDQMDSLLRWFLQSDILRESRYTRTSRQGQRIIHDVRQLCTVLLVFSVEKNGDDRLQDLLFLANTFPRPLDYAVAGGEKATEGVLHEGAAFSLSLRLPLNSLAVHPRDLAHDLDQFLEASKALVVLLFTSTTTWIVVSSIATLVQEIIAEFAGNISDVAQQVQGIAEEVEKVAEGIEATVEDVSKNLEADINTPVSKDAHTSTQVEAAVRAVADNANVAASFAQNTKHRDSADDYANTPPFHIDAHMDSAAEGVQATLLALFEKYLSIWQDLGIILSQPTEPSAPVSRFNSIAADAKILLERLASGKSLDPLCASMNSLMAAVASDPGEDHTIIQLHAYFMDLRRYLDRAFSDSSYVESNICKTDISQMIHRGRIILKAAHKAENLLGNFVHEAQVFIASLSEDHTTIRLLKAFTTLSTDIQSYLSAIRAPTTIATRGGLYLSEAMWNDIAAVAMNAVLSFTQTIFQPNGAVIIPVPRVEYSDTKLDVAVDGRLMRVSLVDDARNEGWSAGVGGDPESRMPNWLTPSSIIVKRWSELHIDFAAATTPENTTPVASSNKVNIRIDGVFAGSRHKVISLDALGYFFRYKPFMGYEDEGMLGFDFEFGGLEGGTIDIILELDTQTASEDQFDFSIASVAVTLPPSLDISVKLTDSRHWILNAMLTPIVLALVKWFVRRELEKVVEQWIRSAINTLANGLHAVRDETQKDGGQSVWTAIMNVITSAQLLGASSADGTDARTESTVSFKGVHIQRTEADAGGASQSTIAIGIAPQILPCKGEPQPLVSPPAMYSHVASEVSDQVTHAEQRLVDVGQQVREGVNAVEELIDSNGDNFSRTENREKRIDGWRSHAFNV